MSKEGTNKRRRRRLYDAQKCLCHWCKCVMVWHDFKSGRTVPDNACTVDHIDSRMSALRGLLPEHERLVAACDRCNRERARQDHEATRPMTVGVAVATMPAVAKPTTRETIAAATMRQCGIEGLVIQKRNHGMHWQGRLNGRVIAEWWPSNGRLVVYGRHREHNYIHDEVMFANVCAVIAENER